MPLSTFIKEYSVFFEIIIIMISSGILTLVKSYLFARVEPRLARSNRVWDHSLLKALDRPLTLFIWVIALSIVLPLVFHRIGIFKVDAEVLNRIRSIAIVLTLFWTAMRYIKLAEIRYETKISVGQKKRDKTTVRALAQLFRISVIIITSLIILQSLHVNVTSLLAFGGVGGIAIGFAAKDTIANFLGGLMIYWDRPFSEGDWIRSPDRDIEGTVENIGWRLTRIRTLDKRPLYVPNGLFSTISIENPSRMTHRRIKTTIGIRYEDVSKLKSILRDTEQMLRHHEGIDTDQTTLVNFTEFADSSLNFLVYGFTKAIDSSQFYQVQQDVLLKIIEIITQHGAECAFPSRSLYFPQTLPVQIQGIQGERP